MCCNTAAPRWPCWPKCGRTREPVAITIKTLMGSNMGQAQVSGGPDAALPDMQHFLTISREHQNRYMEADALQAIGWAHLVAGRPREAPEALTQALGIATRCRRRHALITIHYDLSTILERAGEYARATPLP